MIKILTAMGDQNFNNLLKREKEFEILENDIFYKEGILEFLERNKEIDILILNEKLSGEISTINLVKKIEEINNQINIFFIFENKNEELENLLKKEKIIKIFFNDEINIDEFIVKLKNVKTKNEEKLEEEVKLLKSIINQKDEQLLKYKNQIQKNFEKQSTNQKVIVIVGDRNSGKTMILNNLENSIIDKNKFEFKEVNIENFSEIENLNEVTYKFIFVLEITFEKIKSNKKLIDKLIEENKISLQKVNIIFNKINRYSINKKIAKNIFQNLKIIANIKLNNYSDFLFNEKNNYKYENKKLQKQYLKIIEKL